MVTPRIALLALASCVTTACGIVAVVQRAEPARLATVCPAPRAPVVGDPRDPIYGAQLSRSAFGLRTDYEYVRELHRRFHAAKGKDPTLTRAYAGVTTLDEAQELSDRFVAADDDNPVIQRYFAGRGDIFGGQLLDHSTGKLTALVTANAAGHRRQLHALVRHPDRLAVRQVRYTVAELEALTFDLRPLMGADGEGVEIVGMGEYLHSNSVVVTVSSDLEQARRYLGQRYDTAMFCVQHGEPMRGLEGIG